MTDVASKLTVRRATRGDPYTRTTLMECLLRNRINFFEKCCSLATSGESLKRKESGNCPVDADYGTRRFKRDVVNTLCTPSGSATARPRKGDCFVSRTASMETQDVSRCKVPRIEHSSRHFLRRTRLPKRSQNQFDELGARDNCGCDVRRRGFAI